MATTALLPINSLKRKLANDDFISKRFCFALETDSASSSEEAESIYSVQNQDTASAHDTSDTDDHEFEVESLSEVTLSELSSGPENCVILRDISAIVDSELDCGADLSDTYSSSDDDFGRSAHKICQKCQGDCEEPFTLCLKCFKKKRIYLPPRPKGKRRKNRGTSPRRGGSGLLVSQGSVGSSQDSGVADVHLNSQLNNQASLQGSSQDDNNKNICKCCFASPVDGVFIHKNSVHPMYCYTCSLKQWRLYGRCPFCNQKLCKVAKIFPVED